MSDSKLLKFSNEENKKVSLWSKFRLWWFHTTRRTWWDRVIDENIRIFFTGIKNIFKWLKVVWKDRDWDDFYIFEALKFKIKNTRDYIIKADRVADFHQEQIKRYCTIAIKLIQSIQDEHYQLEYLDYFESEFDFIPTGRTMINEKGKDEELFEMKTKEISSAPAPYFKKYPRIYKFIKQKTLLERPEKAMDEKYISHEMATYNHQRAIELLFKVLASQIINWWD